MDGVGGSVLGLMLLTVYAVVAFVGLSLVMVGGCIFQLGLPTGRICGVLLVVAGIGLPASCCLAPEWWYYAYHGHFPLGALPAGWSPEGKTRSEVRAVLGPPHAVSHDWEDERWDYQRHAVAPGYLAVIFGQDGRVRAAFGN